MFTINAAAFDMVPQRVRDVAGTVDSFLDKHGVPHAIGGGMAVGAYSHSRMTEDVDFIVPEGYESTLAKLGDLEHSWAPQGNMPLITVNMNGIAIDFLIMEGLPEDLLEDSPKVGGLSILKPEALFVMKLKSGRTKDLADIVEMIKSGRVELKGVVKYMKRHGLDDMVDDLSSYKMLAELEKKGQPVKKVAAEIIARRIARDTKS